MPDVHKKTYEEFKKQFVDTGILDVKLLEIYKKMVVRADELLEPYHKRTKNRQNNRYRTL